MKNKLAPPYLTTLDLKSLNGAIMEIYRTLNRISKEAGEVTFRKRKDGFKELVIKDGNKKYVDTSKLTGFSADLAAKKNIQQSSLKKDLSLDKVTNESKTTMFTQPVFTGDAGSGSNPIVNTSASNSIKLAFDDVDENFEVRLIGNNNQNFISFYQAGLAKWAMGFNGASSTIFRIDAGNNLTTDVLQLTSAGALTVDSTVTSSNGVCSGTGALDAGSSTIDTTGAVSTGALTCTTIDTGNGATEIYDMNQDLQTDDNVTFADISGAPVWKDYAFYIFRGTTNRYYHIDQDDGDDYRNWDAYSTISGSDLTIGSQYIGGHFVIPENCTLKAMHGQMYNNGGVSVPTVSVFTGTPSDASDLTVTSRGTVQPNSGSALTSNKNYTFSKTDFDDDLTAGDVVIPTVHYGVGSAQTFIGSLTLKFITR